MCSDEPSLTVSNEASISTRIEALYLIKSTMADIIDSQVLSLKRRRNSIQRICSLPEHVLDSIIMEADDTSSSRWNSSVSSLQTISQTCFFLWSHIKQSRSVWGRLYLWRTRGEPAELQLRKSGNASLDVTMDCFDSYAVNSRGGIQKRHNYDHRLAPEINTVAAESHRWRTLRLTGNLLSTGPSVMLNCLPKSLPRLSSLHLSESSPPTNNNYTPLAVKGGPRLRSVYLQLHGVRVDPAGFTDLRSLQLVDIRNFKPLDNIVKIIQASPRLEDLCIQSVFGAFEDADTYWAAPPTAMSYLETLTLEFCDVDVIGLCLHLITAPKLKTFTCRARYNDKEIPPLTRLSESAKAMHVQRFRPLTDAFIHFVETSCSSGITKESYSIPLYVDIAHEAEGTLATIKSPPSIVFCGSLLAKALQDALCDGSPETQSRLSTVVQLKFKQVHDFAAVLRLLPNTVTADIRCDQSDVSSVLDALRLEAWNASDWLLPSLKQISFKTRMENVGVDTLDGVAVEMVNSRLEALGEACIVHIDDSASAEKWVFRKTVGAFRSSY